MKTRAIALLVMLLTSVLFASTVYAQTATLTLQKTVVNDDTGPNDETGTAVDTDWTLVATGPVIIEGVEGDSEITSAVVPAGVYVLSEKDGPSSNYEASAWVCDGGSQSGTFDEILTLAGNDSVTCVVTNDDIQPGKASIATNSQQANGAEPGTPGSFLISLTRPTNQGAGVNVGYTVLGSSTATAGDDYVALSGTINIPQGATSAVLNVTVNDDFDIEPTETVIVKLNPTHNLGYKSDPASDTATVEIADNDASLTVIKTVVNDSGGSAAASDWTMNVSATLPSSNDFPGAENPGTAIVIGAGAYSVDESGGPDGYAKSLSAGCSGTASAGDVLVCTITNDDIPPPQLTIIKTVVNDGGGTAAASDWTMVVTATNPSNNNFPGAESPGVDITFDAGAYSVDESGGPGGYSKSLGADCSGTLDDGESATCTITNTFIVPELTIIKTVVNDGGGTAAASDWTMVVTASNPSNNNFPGAESPGVDITIDAGDYSVDESGGPGGYVKTLGADCTGTLAGGESATCTITNTFSPDPATLTIIKTVVNDGGGTAAASDWTMVVTASNPSNNNFPGAESPGVEITIDAGDYSVDESGGPGGYVKTLGADCTGTLAGGESATCTITNTFSPDPATLTIIKTVVNDGGGTAAASDWTMVVTASNPSNNNFPGAESPGVEITIDAGDYSVDESGGPGGYVKTLGADCTGTLAGGESATCTITNTFSPDPATLTIIKTVVNDGGGTAAASDWTMVVTASNPSNNNFPGAESPGVEITIDAGDYSVDESGGPGGYVKTLGADCTGTLAGGESATCTITNTFSPDPATLTIIKTVVNDGGGTAAASDWTMVVTASNPSNNNFPGAESPGVEITIDAGDYSVDESGGPGGYVKTLGADCTGTLAGGESATCTITNTFSPDPATLTIIKTVVNDGGGTAAASDWTMVVTASNPSNNNFPGAESPGVEITIDAGDYSVDESGGPGGYVKTLGADCTGTLAGGESATCTITNTFTPAEPANLTIIKTVVNDGGGTASASDWNMIVTASNPSNNNFPGAESPGVDITIDAGDYSVDESVGPDGYGKTLSAECSGTLAAGESAVCTITNTYAVATGTLTLEKEVLNDQGGTAQATDFTLNADGPVSISGIQGSADVTNAVVPVGDYVLTEIPEPGYSQAGWDCTAGLSFGTVTIAEGQNITCTVTNEDDAPVATIIASIPDAGEPDKDGQFAVTLSPAPPTDAEVIVTYAVQPESTAIAGVDYVALSGSVVVDDTGVGYIDVVIIDDNVIESTKTVVVALTNVNDPAYTLEDPNVPATVSIEDDDGGGIFSIDDLTIAELDRTGFVRVTRFGGSKGAASVDYASADGSAITPEDYTAVQGTLFWEAGDSDPQWIELTVRNDNKDEGDEYFTVNLSNPQNDGGFLVDIDKGVGVITITDPIPIPTLGAWAMILMSLMLGLFGMFHIRTRQGRVT